MPAVTPVRYVIGDVEIDVANRSVRRGGEESFLRPKTFQVLLFLIENRGRTISKDEILQAVWPGTAITEDTLVQSIVDIRKAVGDDPRDPWFIRTIPRRGYELIAAVEEAGPLARLRPAAPVAAASVALEERQSVSITVEETYDEGRTDWRHFIPHIAVALVVLILGALVATLLLRREPAAPVTAAVPRRIPVTIAPFQNRTDSHELDWLRDGLPAMVMTQLATAPDLNMIAGDILQRHLVRVAASEVADRDLSLWVDAARRAGAQRLITGSFHRSGDQIRVDAQIHDVSTRRISGGGSVVSDQQSLLNDVDLLTSKLAGALGSRLLITANSRLSDLMTGDLEAYRLYTLGVRAADRLQNKEAIAYLEKAVARDPGFAMAYARIGYAYGITWTRAEVAQPYFAKALELGARLSERERLYVLAWQAAANNDYATAIDHFRIIVSRYPTDVEAYERLGRLLLGEQRVDEAIDVLRRGLAVDRESPQINNSLGGALATAGSHAEAIAHHQRYVALSPNDPNAYDSLGASYQRAGDYERALAAYDQALRLDPDFEVAVVHRANTYWQMGRNRDAIREYDRYIAIAPSSLERQRGYAELMLMYRSLGDRVREAEAARAVSRAGPPSMFTELLLEVHRGDLAAAKQRMQSATGAAPGRGARSSRRFEHYVAAEVARASGDRQAAIASAREAVRHLPPHYLAEDREDVLADTFAAFAQWPDAIEEYRRVLTINPNRGRTRYKLARTLDAAGKEGEARIEYERFLQIWSSADSDAPELVDARRRLSRVPFGR